MDAKSLKGIAVVTMHDGQKVGAVDNILFDPEGRAVDAFSIGSGSLLGGSNHLVDMRDVQSIGSDAIMVTDRGVLRTKQSDARYNDLLDLGAITSLRVVSTEGSVIGNLNNVRFDPYSGAITDLEVGHGGILGALRSNSIVPINQVVSIGRDVAVVRDVSAVDEASSSQTGVNNDAGRHA